MGNPNTSYMLHSYSLHLIQALLGRLLCLVRDVGVLESATNASYVSQRTMSNKSNNKKS